MTEVAQRVAAFVFGVIVGLVGSPATCSGALPWEQLAAALKSLHG
jgi:hypothetical protein